MGEFLDNPDVLDRPEKHHELIQEMKMEAILATENSPYSEVRAVVEPTDDPTMPVLTIRVWLIGCVFAAAGSFIDAFFLMRNPPVYIGANVAQLLSCESQTPWYSADVQTHADDSSQRSCPTTASSCLVASTA